MVFNVPFNKPLYDTMKDQNFSISVVNVMDYSFYLMDVIPAKLLNLSITLGVFFDFHTEFFLG